jgi:DNA repair exonuclease SbcCD ATPase subunit
MRIAGILVLLCLSAAVGCKNKGDADAAPDPEAVKAQQELIARRDKLLDARKKLQSDKDKLDVEIKEIQAKGGDASEQLKKKAELESELESQNETIISMVNSKLDGLGKAADKTAQVASREAEIASREKAVADREARIADREKALAQRDAESAARWKESCSVGAPMIIQSSAPKDGKYTNKDVSALIQKAKAAMSKKGLINTDLPGPAQTLEGEAGKALNENDMSKAYFAAAQLVATVDAITINRQFIQAKTSRLSAQAKTMKLDEGTNKQLADILGDVMQKYNDGDFGAANRRLNQLAGILAKN